MTVPPGHRLTARWASQQPRTLVITDQATTVLAAFPATLAVVPPGPLMLCGTGWAACPGSEWDEEPPGCWTVAVFRHPQPAQDETSRA